MSKTAYITIEGFGSMTMDLPPIDLPEVEIAGEGEPMSEFDSKTPEQLLELINEALAVYAEKMQRRRSIEEVAMVLCSARLRFPTVDWDNDPRSYNYSVWTGFAGEILNLVQDCIEQ